MDKPEPTCPRCERPDCPHFNGGRSEANYIDCLEHTAARANHMRDAVHRTGENGEWAAIWTWMDRHKDAVVKRIVDTNGRLEIELAVLRERLRATEYDYKKMSEELDELAGAPDDVAVQSPAGRIACNWSPSDRRMTCNKVATVRILFSDRRGLLLCDEHRIDPRYKDLPYEDAKGAAQPVSARARARSPR